MRGLIFTTGSQDTEKMYQSFTYQYPDTKVVQYDLPNVNMVAIAQSIRPDIIVWIGAHRGSHHIPGIRPVPDTAELVAIGKIAPMVHMCPDSGDTPWWPEIEDFHKAGAFRLQVGIDGCHESPIAQFGMVALTPIDPAYFADVPWEQKTYKCGFAGGLGFRTPLISSLTEAGLLTKFEERSSYQSMCDFYTKCKMVINDARTGTGTKRHVKGRFLEAALAGAVPIEPHDAPTKDWFKPGEEYLIWHDIEEIKRHIIAIDQLNDRYADMARHLKAKVIAEHSAPVFWNKVLTRMGLQ